MTGLGGGRNGFLGDSAAEVSTAAGPTSAMIPCAVVPSPAVPSCADRERRLEFEKLTLSTVVRCR
jgi:hypothetical protein